MAANCKVYELGNLALVGVVAVLAVSLLSGWVQIVVGVVLLMLIVAVATGRYLSWRLAVPVEEEPESQHASSAKTMTPP